MLYTIYPVENVMDEFDDDRRGAQMMEVARPNGAKLLVEQTGNQEGRLERVISADPKDYLDPSLQPGSKVRFRPEFM